MKKVSVLRLLTLGCVFAFSPLVFADGQKTYEKSCKMCHASGMAGAPKVGDKAAWKNRIAKGTEALQHSAIKGIGYMAPKAGNASLADDDVKAAVIYMVSESE